MAAKVNLRDTTLLLTRPEKASRRFSGQVAQTVGNFGRVVIAPLFEIVPLSVAEPPCLDDEIAFTSENGVLALSQFLDPGRHSAWCVGHRTAERARVEGYAIRTIQPNVAALIDTIIEQAPSATIVHVAGRHRHGAMTEKLHAAGLSARTIEAYDQRSHALSIQAQELLDSEVEIVAPVFSPRSARLLAEAAANRRARIHVVAISVAAEKEWKSGPEERVLVAPSSDTAGVLAAMGSLFDAEPSA